MHIPPNYMRTPPGATLEQIVLSNSKPYFKSYQVSDPTDKWRAAAQKIGRSAVNKKSLTMPSESAAEEDLIDQDDETNCCNKRWCWWSPVQDTIAVAFCNETSIHGFKFLGQTKRHFSERIFWVVAFLLSFSAAVYLIYGVWNRYERSPVIVSFQSSEQDIDSIPFPAVTLCNINKFPKSKVLDIQRVIADPGTTSKEKEVARKKLLYVRSVCNAQQSFAKEFDFAFNRGAKKEKALDQTVDTDSEEDMMQFILSSSLPCGDMIRLCMRGDEKRNCSRLFKPVMTDYGKCCTFNILPLPFLLQDPHIMPNETYYDNPILGKNAKDDWPQEEMKKWEKWDYEKGFVIENRSAARPWRQKRAGLPYGLSLLIDSNADDYYCTASDSYGVKYILHTPLEMPHVVEFASVADMGKEILIEVHPDMTNADEDIRGIVPERRKCFFGIEKDLHFFGPYTGGNCLDECSIRYFGRVCNCTFFYMPREKNVKICNSDPNSKEHKCIDKARITLQKIVKDECKDCETLCEDIAYNYETTIANLQNSSMLWGDPDPVNNTKPTWWNNKMSILHIFFGSETTVPKFRKRLYGTTDLIASTGGILGLCLGFSVLSGVEVVYFITIRWFWKACRRRRVRRRVAGNILAQIFKPKNNNREINLNPQMVQVYPGYGAAQDHFMQNSMQRVRPFDGFYYR